MGFHVTIKYHSPKVDILNVHFFQLHLLKRLFKIELATKLWAIDILQRFASLLIVYHVKIILAS